MKLLPPTKRSVLRISAKMFDPLGLLSPFIIGAKILFQVLCKSKQDWDSILDGKLIQGNTFTEEYRRLLSGEIVIYKGWLILFLNDDHTICCRGHLNQSDLPSSMKTPVFPPTKHRFTELLVMERHNAVHYNGTPETLTAVRERYWIAEGRVVVKKVIRRCFMLLKYSCFYQLL